MVKTKGGVSKKTPLMSLWNRYGIIDLGWKNAQEIWAVGGGGTMYVSKVRWK